MKSSTAIASIILASVLLSAPSEAQYRAPAGVQRLELSTGLEPSTAGTRRDTTVGPPEISVARGIVGGVLGGVGGAFVGTMVGAASASGCRGEYCAFGAALVGFGIGEAVGLAVGTHLGARGRGNVAATALSSVGMLIGGLVVAATAPRGTPPIALTLVPAAQLAVALALER
jgi:hypothetical protein